MCNELRKFYSCISVNTREFSLHSVAATVFFLLLTVCCELVFLLLL